MSKNSGYSATQFPLRISRFRAILETRNSEEVVGYACRSTICSLAKILKKECGGWDIYVHKNVTFFGGHNYENPSWVRKFVDKVDEKLGISNVTTVQALEILNNLHICTVCNKYNPEGKNCGKDNCDW
jgi:hypothetical protein